MPASNDTTRTSSAPNQKRRPLSENYVSDDYDRDDEKYDDESYVASPKSIKQKTREQITKIFPYVPYVLLAVGVRTKSTHWLLASVFAVVAVKPSQRYVTVQNCNFTSTPVPHGASTGLMVR
jgi:hypothetical protein